MPRSALIHLLLTALLVSAIAGCTRENKAFCCTSLEDCQSAGIDDTQRDCSSGLACVDHACVVPSCASAGCEATAPVCDLQTDVCSPCTDSSECTRFPATDVCEPSSGSCVACVAATDCGSLTPVCDGHACRACRLDSECASGACGDDGSCVPEANAVYVATTGSDVPPCSRAQPCGGLGFALQETSASRNHVVVAPGVYVSSLITVSPTTTSAPFLTIHGGGATLSAASDDGLLLITRPGKLRDIELNNTNSAAASVATTYTFEHVVARGGGGSLSSTMIVNGAVTMRDVAVAGTGCGIRLDGGALNVDRGTITSETVGICANAPAVIDIANLVVSHAAEVGLDLPGVTGTIAFSTIADTGATGTGAAGLSCTLNGLVVSSTILWTPTLTSRPVVSGGCVVSGSIVGPPPLVGNTNTNPMFVSPNTNNYRLSGGSPARDVVNTGPATDFEGDLRPQGARFDLGADEGQ